MVNSLQSQSRHHETERNAYNAAFYELGFRWHWDSETYDELLGQKSDSAEQIHHYLNTRQPHLLKAYDAAFLVNVIHQKKALHINRGAASPAVAARHFNWADTLGSELGA